MPRRASNFAQSSVSFVGEVVVGHHPPGLDAVGGEEAQGAFGERGDGVGALVGVELCVGQARVVIDDRVGELPADSLALLGTGDVAIAGNRVPGTRETGELLDVHVHEIARAGPLIANDLAAIDQRATRTAPPAQDPRNGGVGDIHLGRDQPRAPTRPPADLADTVMVSLRADRRARSRARGPTLQAGQRRPLLSGSAAPTRHPSMSGRGRHVRSRQLPPRT
jgi:hypothetical protein